MRTETRYPRRPLVTRLSTALDRPRVDLDAADELGAPLSLDEREFALKRMPVTELHGEVAT